jgi:heterodisulfide reductase subunit A
MPETKEPHIGVYICDCGGNISDTVRCDQVADALGKLSNVVVARRYQFMCSDPGQKLITDDIEEKGVDRVVVGACSIFLHEQTFRRTVQRAGLNPYLYYHIGLREQDSWVHHTCSPAATEKAMHMLSAGIAKARLMQPLEPVQLSADKHVLVIGGGVAGLSSALSLSRRGLPVTLIEKSNSLGGHIAQWEHLFPTNEDARTLLNKLIEDVKKQSNLRVLTGVEVVAAKGYVGNFDIRIRQQSSSETELKVGAVVIATGFQPYEPFPGELGY